MPSLAPGGRLALALWLCGCSSGASSATSPAGVAAPGKPPITPCTADGSAPVPADRCTTDPTDTTLPPCFTWLKVEIPGTVCSDGSQFKFFVNYSNTSNDLEVSFEPGGACWDYDSCSGNDGIRGAANPNGIPDDHMSNYQYLNFLRRPSDAGASQNPAESYNMVFVSYCTGDVHTGDNVETYTSSGPVDGGTGPDGSGQLTYIHAGHANTLAVIAWMQQSFPIVPRLFVTGCSAGGAGALLNYSFIRQGMGSSVQCSYLLDDSGPIFDSAGPSMQIDETIRAAWNTDAVLDTLDGPFPPGAGIDDIKKNYALINTVTAWKYPHDRLALVAYRMDLNYSLYSYQRFFPGSTEAQIHALWWEDLQRMMATYDAQANLAYYLPFFRSDNCSHCVSIPPVGNPPTEPTNDIEVLTQPWMGSGIAADMIDLHQYSEDLLDDMKPLKSYVEAPQSEDFTPAVAMACMAGG